MRNNIIAVLIALIALLVPVSALAEEEAETAGTTVIIETSLGTMEVLLFDDKAPITVKNFLEYVDAGHYDGTIFHRVIAGFMIQGGGFDPSMQRRETRPPIKNEADNGLKNTTGTLAMARTSAVDSATDQFFINTVDNKFLDNGVRDFGYAVFGTVVDGLGVVKEIETVQTARGDKPVEDVVITSIKRK
jgi:peptidyl-prolyl cis-trans isomerase A (cyclophilin A)